MVTLNASLTRIADFDCEPFDISRKPRKSWATGDYVIGRITGPAGSKRLVETVSGRIVEAFRDDIVIGAFGDRAGTLEAVGSWRDMRDDAMHAMTSAGLFGTVTSLSATVPSLTELEYLGHAVRSGKKVCMRDFAVDDDGEKPDVPIVLLFGTSMSAGKTTTGRRIVHELATAGHNVIGVKLTGAGRYRDILSFRDAGAVEIFDFVDAGLPSTVVPEADFRAAVRPLLARIAALKPDVLVVEAGASPLEPYNGAAAIDELGDAIRCKVLCASDPYAVVGVQHAFGVTPDLVTGPAASTTAGIDLVQKLAGLPAVNVLDPACGGPLRKLLDETLML